MDAQTFEIEDAMMTALAGLMVDTDKLRLFKSTFVPNQNNVLADFLANEVAFTGYAAVVLSNTWRTGYDAGGNPEILNALSGNFVQTAITATDTAGGWFVTDTASGAIKLFGNLASPFSFNKVGNELTLQLSIRPTFSSDASAGTLIGP